MLALSLNLVNGFTGLFSLGHAGFMAVGAYTCALLTMTPEQKEMNFFLEPIVPWLANLTFPFVPALVVAGLSRRCSASSSARRCCGSRTTTSPSRRWASPRSSGSC